MNEVHWDRKIMNGALHQCSLCRVRYVTLSPLFHRIHQKGNTWYFIVNCTFTFTSLYLRINVGVMSLNHKVQIWHAEKSLHTVWLNLSPPVILQLCLLQFWLFVSFVCFFYVSIWSADSAYLGRFWLSPVVITGRSPDIKLQHVVFGIKITNYVLHFGTFVAPIQRIYK